MQLGPKFVLAVELEIQAIAEQSSVAYTKILLWDL